MRRYRGRFCWISCAVLRRSVNDLYDLAFCASSIRGCAATQSEREFAAPGRTKPQASTAEAAGEYDRSRRRARQGRSRRRARVGVGPIEPAAAAERKVDQKDSRSEATLSFPLFASLRRGPSAGGLALWGRLLLLTFLGETRKVSGCRAAPGAFSRPERESN